MAGIDLYFFPTPNGNKITIALEEMELPYTVHMVNIMKGEQHQPEFLRISPNGRIPAIVDHEAPGGPLSLFESGAILQYLGRKTGAFYPADERARASVDAWLFWQMGGLGPMSGQAAHFVTFAPEKIPYAINRYTEEVKRLYGVMEGQLSGRAYLADTYSIADMAAWPWLGAADRLGIALDPWPNLAAWRARIGDRPAVKRAMVKAAPPG